MIVTTVQVRCDDCDRLFRGKGATGAQVRQAAKDAGWQIMAPHGRDYCPEHHGISGKHRRLLRTGG